MNLAEVRLALQALGWVAYLSIVIMGFILAHLIKTPKALLFMLPIILWGLHGVIFYTVVVGTRPIPTIGITTWSTILRLQGAVTLAVIMAVEIYFRVKHRRGKIF